MAIVGLDHIQLAAPEGAEEQARRYFGDVLGLVEVEKPQTLRARGGVWFALGEQQLHIGVDHAFAPARKAHPALRVDGDALDELAERLRAAGERWCGMTPCRGRGASTRTIPGATGSSSWPGGRLSSMSVETPASSTCVRPVSSPPRVPHSLQGSVPLNRGRRCATSARLSTAPRAPAAFASSVS